MSPTNSKKRPSIQEILTTANLKADVSGSEMSESDIAGLLAPISGLSKNLFLLSMKAGNALGKTLNIKSSKKIETEFPYSYPSVVRALVIALGSLQNEIVALFDTPKGAFIEAKLPTDLFSLGGSLTFEIIDQAPTRVRILGASEIKGQRFDWGKGKRSLQQIFEKTHKYVTLLAT
jgi:hypothetical protein